MNLLGVFTRFGSAYILFNIIAGTALSFFGLKTASGVPIVILAGATLFACNAFAKKNNVYFSKHEKIKVIFVFALINLIFSSLFSILFLVSSSLKITGPVIAAIIVEAGIIHTIIIYFIVRLVGKQFEKQNQLNDKKHIEIYSTKFHPEAILVKDLLETNNIRCYIIGDRNPSIENSLFIEGKSKLEKAKKLIKEFEQSANESLSPLESEQWACSSCGEESEGHFTSCWKCGGSKPSTTKE